MIKVALLYDFDKTLCDKDMQEYSFIPNMNVSANDFWHETTKLYSDNSIEKILAYMYQMKVYSKRNNISLTKEYLSDCGKNIDFFAGVKTWFDNINQYGAKLGLEIEHYIISSGLKEIIDGCQIASHFKEIYSCCFHYDSKGVADFPGFVVNYTMKTQYLYRISKGAFDMADDIALNNIVSEENRRIKMKNMIYFGDGLTDVPCMRLVKEQGGHSICVYNQKMEIANKLLEDKRCNFIAPANYLEGNLLDQIVKKILDKIKIDEDLINFSSIIK